ncbi:entericidin A/B family lipoprotein [Rubrimonas cliftonensis]|uniref:Predicted small secreted protein n=1 Tax=Rubrimonas cliftonensis TaxID=89524 RepID=A0A1H4C5U1_9RHOB|nr:entericidin A/B family lipoprotein [Rubrimonas cliftonensis]SEA55754.1 Predicted small secreted protein [Rubrimonas cliftonensis]
MTTPIRAAALALAALLALSACNTVQGVGKDVQSGGEAIQQGAEKVQEGL